jgi:CheY-like chemotaxis protein
MASGCIAGHSAAFDAPGDGPAALVIDDSGVERLLAAAMLRKLGFQAQAAPDAQAALALMSGKRYTLVLCDISLPGIDGLTLLTAMRNLDADLRCIIQSSHDDEARKAEALQRGAAAYLVKPLRLAVLAETLRGVFPEMGGMMGE